MKQGAPPVASAIVVVGADTDAGADHARALAACGAVLVLAGDDAARLGALAAELAALGARAALFLGTPGPALVELVAELFEPR